MRLPTAVVIVPPAYFTARMAVHRGVMELSRVSIESPLYSFQLEETLVKILDFRA